VKMFMAESVLKNLAITIRHFWLKRNNSQWDLA